MWHLIAELLKSSASHAAFQYWPWLSCTRFTGPKISVLNHGQKAQQDYGSLRTISQGECRQLLENAQICELTTTLWAFTCLARCDVPINGASACCWHIKQKDTSPFFAKMSSCCFEYLSLKKIEAATAHLIRRSWLTSVSVSISELSQHFRENQIFSDAVLMVHVTKNWWTWWVFGTLAFRLCTWFRLSCKDNARPIAESVLSALASDASGDLFASSLLLRRLCWASSSVIAKVTVTLVWTPEFRDHVSDLTTWASLK
jgi:hypothetical protein